jgi:uncharacterized protein YndB with AHSA1/START domain
MTASTETATSVRATVDVAATPEHAFEVFAAIDSWWNRDHHLLPGALKACGIEPHLGGSVWEENDAGERCTWGSVLAWDPPRAFAFSWLLGVDFGMPEPDAVGSRVTVSFTPTETGTHVELVHDRLEAHGTGWEGLREALDEGWPELLVLYAAAL